MSTETQEDAYQGYLARIRTKFLASVREEWIDLRTVIFRSVPSSVMADVVSGCEDAGLIELQKAKGTIQVRKKAK